MDNTIHRAFLLRIWTEPEHNGKTLFRAALVDVASRETRYFSDAVALADHLRSLGEAPEQG